MAKGHRSQIKRERNANKDTRPSAKLSYARVSVQKACFVLDAIRGKDVESAIGILTYKPKIRIKRYIKNYYSQQLQMLKTTTIWMLANFILLSVTQVALQQ